MAIILNRNSRIEGTDALAVQRAAAAFDRDIKKVFLKSEKEGSFIILIRESMEQEQFVLKAVGNRLEIHGGDELGFIYGIYEVSRVFLGVKEFWFWNDQKFERKEEAVIPDEFEYASKPCTVRYRGWFINDEVLLHKWSVERKKDLPWEMVFETLLRCRGNMVIPGTDRNSGYYRKLASEMGLYITHHHAEPLGAEMFARVYPELTPSYAEHYEKFHGLWKNAIKAQKDMRVIWNLGFRGQGDCPFWVSDPQYATDEARGKLLGSLIRMQYDLVKEADEKAVCCTNLYGEIMELYQKGCVELPEDIIKIWADNGYGKMVSRRQNNHNPRVPALPEKGNQGHNGIYYHVSFYDLQAANHITMFPNSPYFLKKELKEVLERNGSDFWIINSSNIKPHVYFLDLIAKMWREGDVDVDSHRSGYVDCYYGSENKNEVEKVLAQYPEYAVQYGKNEDDHAGEQFVNHVPRVLLSQFMKDRTERSEELCWMSDRVGLKEQTVWFGKLCEKGSAGYKEYLDKCLEVYLKLQGDGKLLFEDSLLLQVRLLYHCYQGAFLCARSVLAGLNGAYRKAFYLAGKARKEYLEADSAMRSREHGKWHEFYANECLTDVKQTAYVLEGMMSFVRNLDDGPHFYEWQRDFLYAEEDRRVSLILNMDNHLRDQELFELMEEKWDNKIVCEAER